MKLFIIRHGETEDNLQKIVQGHQQGKLTEKGREQARKLAQRLSKERIDVIYSSDLQRARDTTEELAHFHPTVPVYYTPEVRERCMGIFEGKPYKTFDALQSILSVPIEEFIPEKGESLLDVHQRAQKFLYNTFKLHQNNTVLVSSHGQYTRMLLTILLNKPIKTAPRIIQSNACLNIAEMRTYSQTHVYLINCTQHLEEFK